MKIAIIDCGTNTFTLSLYEVDSSKKFKRILKDRHYVELAEEGIQKIGSQAFQRGINAFEAFHALLKNYPETKTVAIGTAALRSASNRDAFLDAVEVVSGIRIQIITGDREAHLIYKGVCSAAPLGIAPSLIMDIGGGSVEFIIANQDRVYWAKSYPVGVAVLFNAFHRSDPIQVDQIKDLNDYLETALSDLTEQLSSHSIEHLIGASGSFDVLGQMNPVKNKANRFSFIEADSFHKICQQLIDSNYEKRLRTKNLSSTRAKLIVVSILLLNFIHQKINTPNLIVSDYAIQEGLVYELLAS